MIWRSEAFSAHGFNEAEALKPRIQEMTTPAAPTNSGFNEAEALKPRIPLVEGENGSVLVSPLQ